VVQFKQVSILHSPVGASEGAGVGSGEGAGEGSGVGSEDGAKDGYSVGSSETGSLVGDGDGADDGADDGAGVGPGDGAALGKESSLSINALQNTSSAPTPSTSACSANVPSTHNFIFLSISFISRYFLFREKKVCDPE